MRLVPVAVPLVLSAVAPAAGRAAPLRTDHAAFPAGSHLSVDWDLALVHRASLRADGWVFGVFLTVTIPFDRLARPRRPPELLMSSTKAPWAVAVVPALAVVPAVVPALAKEPRVVAGHPSPSGSLSNPSSAVASSAPSITPSVAPAPASSPARALALDGEKIRALVAAAHKLAGLDRDDVFDGMASRARASALLPEVRLRVFRTADAGLRVYQDPDVTDAPRSTILDGTQTGVEARLSFRLDRLVFADEEVPIERLRLERLELKQKIATRVIELVVRWAKAQRASRDTLLLDVEREAAAATALESLAALDAYTGGLASKLLLGKA